MTIDKDTTVNMLRSDGQDRADDRARQDPVVTDVHAWPLGKLGINLLDLIAKFTGGQRGQGGIRGVLGKLR